MTEILNCIQSIVFPLTILAMFSTWGHLDFEFVSDFGFCVSNFS